MGLKKALLILRGSQSTEEMLLAPEGKNITKSLQQKSQWRKAADLQNPKAQPFGNPSLLNAPTVSTDTASGAMLLGSRGCRQQWVPGHDPPSSVLPEGVFTAEGSQSSFRKALLGTPPLAAGPLDASGSDG